MPKISSLTDFFQQTQCDILLVDLGRKVKVLSQQDFARIEANQIPYPFPIQGQSQLALTFWQGQEDPWIWFLQFPLDERGLLKQALVNDFIQYVLVAFNTDLTQPVTEEMKQKLANNPYTFRPQDDKLSVFHALLSRHIANPCSAFYTPARTYLSGINGWDAWQHIGLQGFADICVNLDRDQNVALVQQALHALPQTPLYALLGCLEHVIIPDPLAQELLSFFAEEEIQAPDIFLLCAVMRALGGADITYLQRAIRIVMKNDALMHREMFIAIAGRCWHVFEDPAILSAFFIALAQQDKPVLFNQIFIDLVALPQIRIFVLSLLRDPQNTDLANALNRLKSLAKQGE